MFEVFPQKFMPLSLSLLSVSANYTLDTADKRALIRASSVLARLARVPSLAPVDADRQMPLLVPANRPAAEDRDAIGDAIRLLAADMRTHQPSVELARLDRHPEYQAIPGWRWLRAARLLGSARMNDAKKGSFAYLAAVARNLREADRDRPLGVRDAPALTAADLEGVLDG